MATGHGGKKYHSRFVGCKDDAIAMPPKATERPVLKLIGQDGNAFNTLGLALRAARRAGWSQAQMDEYKSKATSGDYNDLLTVTMEYFDVQ